jgi:hypothetical protein
MAKFRKKPVVIEAVRYRPFGDTPGVSEERLIHWKRGEKAPTTTVVTAYVETLEGRMEVSVGDWIIKGVNGEFYPCKPDIFEKTYEPVSE